MRDDAVFRRALVAVAILFVATLGVVKAYGFRTPEPLPAPEDPIVLQQRGAARIEVFFTCLSITANATRLVGDDTAEAVDACERSSLALTQFVGKR